MVAARCPAGPKNPRASSDPHAAAAARRQNPALLLDDTDHFGANSAEPRNTHSQGCDHDAKDLPERRKR